jgi:hypothetical protein
VEVFSASPGNTSVYIDNVNGDDANTGQAASPWGTFDHARNLLRPRDTLYFNNTGVAYPGGMMVYSHVSGKHEHGKITISGDPSTLTKIDATGHNFGIQIVDTDYLEISNFDIHSASNANLFTTINSRNTDIVNNRLHDSSGRGFLGSGDFTLHHNLIYNNTGAGAFIYLNGTNARIYNNVFAENDGNGLELGYNWSFYSEVKNNIFTSNGRNAMRRGPYGQVDDGYNCVDGIYSGVWNKTGNINGPPLMTDQANANFTLQPGSPCIDSGVDLNLPGDFLGNVAVDDPSTPNAGSPGNYLKDYLDIGAFEYTP